MDYISMKKLLIIDGNSLANRAFYALPLLSNSKGVYTNAVYGFLSILFKILEDLAPQYLAVAFDLKAPTFRHKKYDGYKATRKGMPDELRMQMPIIKDILRAMNIDVLEIEEDEELRKMSSAIDFMEKVQTGKVELGETITKEKPTDDSATE